MARSRPLPPAPSHEARGGSPSSSHPPSQSFYSFLHCPLDGRRHRSYGGRASNDGNEGLLNALLPALLRRLIFLPPVARRRTWSNA